MRIVLLHDDVAASARPDDQDVFGQLAAVAAALAAQGHEPVPLAIGMDLGAARDALARLRPDLVFNLVESLGGSGRLVAVAPALLEALGLPYTGCPASAMALASEKLQAKRWLAAHGLPTPEWLAAGEAAAAGRWIVKSVWEDASIGLDADSVVDLTARDDLPALLAARAARCGGAAFAEAYVEGREILVSLLAGPRGPELLPVTELVYEAWPEGVPRIWGYTAKWDVASYEWDHVLTRLDFPPEDAKLLREVRELSLRAWHAFGLAGFARVDFRIDAEGRPWVLEVNPNPSLAPDAGFVEAAERAGLDLGALAARLVADALARR